ncbi:hypothetical protein HanRHA438_Chr05g0239011 [Helianthus annuus]|nr:hypothetical protein HanRHA438_Chr05g0239011 [Helianthus annuus]
MVIVSNGFTNLLLIYILIKVWGKEKNTWIQDPSKILFQKIEIVNVKLWTWNCFLKIP